MKTDIELPESKKRQSRIEAVISIAYLLVVAMLMKSTEWFLGDAIEAHFGRKSGAFTLFIVIPLSFLLGALVTFVSAYFLTSWTCGKEMAERVLFRWRH